MSAESSAFDGSQVSLGSKLSADGGAATTPGGGGAGPLSENTYTIRPNFHLKFRPPAIKDVLRTVLHDELSGKEYDSESAKQLSEQTAELIRQKLKDLELDRYKYVVQVVIGEQRGQGIKLACRCLWDSDTDNVAQEAYLGETMFGIAVVFGVFHY